MTRNRLRVPGRQKNPFLVSVPAKRKSCCFAVTYHVNTYKNIDPARLLSGGYDSLHAHSDKGMLLNDEIVVYSDDAATIRYLVEIAA